jgi:hypothetical protein
MIESIFEPARKALTCSQNLTDSDREVSELTIKKISELMMYSEGQVKDNLSQPLLFYYKKVSGYQERLNIVKAIHKSIQNEDILLALSMDVF